MATLFGKAKSTINEHIRNIYAEGELQKASTLQKFGNSEFQQKPHNYYNLDVVISVGNRGQVTTRDSIQNMGYKATKGVCRQGLCTQ